MKHTIKIIIASVLLSVCNAYAQEKNLEKADEEFETYSFIDARDAYLKAAADGYKPQELLMRLGDSYYFNADYDNAAKWYGTLFDVSDNMDTEYLYRYALSLKSSGKYDASDRMMNILHDRKGEDYRANLFVNERNYLEEIEAQSGRFELNKIGFNSELSDFAPAFYQGDLAFASNRLGTRGVVKRVHDWNDQPFLDIYTINPGEGEEKSTNLRKLDNNINSIYHESTAIYSKDGNTMYFTRNNYTNKDYKEDSEGTNKLKLYRAKRDDSNTWEVEELPFNSDEYSVAHPALSKDEKTLYFASDMPGTKGQSDLYKVAINDDGFGEVQNLGDAINTESRETFPFISSDNKLFFASDGRVGLGGLDIFVAEMNGDNFGDVYNLGRPVNSKYDDFTFIINGTTGLGYFASNREGGVGSDDIYSFKSIKPLITKCTQGIEGFVLDRVTDDPIGYATVKLLDENNTVIDETTSRPDGSFSFDLDCKKQYSIRSEKEGFDTAEKVFSTPNKTGEIERTLFMRQPDDLPAPVGTDLGPLLGITIIYFDLDKDFIRSDAEVELRKLIAVMKTYPKLKIDVRSHTDSRNTDVYNADLSTRRANSTVDYLVNVGGISRDRLTGKGYGESQLVNRCKDGTPCSESEHQMNRRSEFIIVE